VLVAVCASDVRATTAVLPTLEEQVAEARAIALGRCTRIESREIDGQIFSYITLDVTEVLKGPIAPGVLVVKQAGGKVGTFGQWIDGSPMFEVGRESLVFLAADGEGALQVYGLFLGHFNVEVGPDGAPWAVRDAGESALVLPRVDVAPDRLSDRMPVDDVRRLAAVLAGVDLKADQAPAVRQVPLEYTRPFEGPSETTNDFTLMGSNRWFEADTGQEIPFYCNTENFLSDFGNRPDLEAAEADALAAWSTVPGSSLRLRYGGVDASGCGWKRDGVSRVSVDCFNQIGGEGCHGIIAIGGANQIDFNQTITVNGTVFHRILEADVCLNEGFCDLYLDEEYLRYVLAHELGHCIGFGHSSTREATMYSTLLPSIASRGAELHDDDIAGARFVYPGAPVEPEPEPPVIGTVALPGGTVGFPYNQVLTVSGGKAPFVWALSSGTPPPGLTVTPNGLVTGTPGATGSFSFGVRVTDALGRSAERAFGVVVQVPPPAVAAVRYRKGAKRLTITGTNFAPTAQIAINGLVVSPGRPTTYDPTTSAFDIRGNRKKLNLNRGVGNNSVVVTVENVSSAPFMF
jgi:hypothetical protein